MTVYILVYNERDVDRIIGVYKTEQSAKFGMSIDRSTAHKGALSYAYDIVERELED